MPYRCVVTTTADYLRVDVSGDWRLGQELADASAVWKQVSEACRNQACTRVLAVWDVAGRLPTVSAYALAAHPESFGWDRSIKAAVVHRHKERLQDSLFAETVGVNRGYDVKVFGDEEKALAWLLA